MERIPKAVMPVISRLAIDELWVGIIVGPARNMPESFATWMQRTGTEGTGRTSTT